MRHTGLFINVLAGSLAASFSLMAAAEEPDSKPELGETSDLPTMRFTLDEPAQASEPVNLGDLGALKEVPSTKIETRPESEIKDWDIVGPIRMRSADPEPPGEFEIRDIFDYGTSSDGTNDDIEYEMELEWGIAPNHELIVKLPVEMGEGGVEGNADLTLGSHWRLWKEKSILPAFAMRNFIRIPNGYHSSGVDYELRGLITKSIIPNKFRLHLNPFLKSINGDNEEDHRFFQWGVIAGVDYQITDTLVLNAAYVNETSEMEGERNQHTFEIGADWEFAPHQTLGFVTRTGLDGDDVGENWGFAISYIVAFDDFPFIR